MDINKKMHILSRNEREKIFLDKKYKIYFLVYKKD